MSPTRNLYADRQRCEAAGLKYGQPAIVVTLVHLAGAAQKQQIPLLDQLATQLNLQCAAYLESQYERAGVISGGGEQ